MSHKAKTQRLIWCTQFWRWCARCSARSRQREALSTLDDHLLEDIGVTRQQASSLGQFAGPAVLGLWVESFGWKAAPEILAPAALFGLACALVLRRLLDAAA